MDEKEEKNETPIQEGITPPNCGSHVKPEFPHQQMCGRGLGMPCGSTHLDEIYREKISESIKNGFETLSNSLVECALILSSEDYAKSLVKEREDKKREEEAKKKEEEENRKRMKEESEKILDLYKEKLKDQIYSTNLSDDEKAEIFHTLIADAPYGARTLQSIENSIACNVSQFVKKAFCGAIKEVKPELVLDETMNFDPMMLAMIVPSARIPPITFMALTSRDGKSAPIDPMLFMMMNGMNSNASEALPFLMMNSKNPSDSD